MFLGDVGGIGHGSAAKAPDLGGYPGRDCGRLVLSGLAMTRTCGRHVSARVGRYADVIDHDRCPTRGEFQRELAPEAAASAGHHGDPVVEAHWRGTTDGLVG